jgi:hypothetical protein
MKELVKALVRKYDNRYEPLGEMLSQEEVNAVFGITPSTVVKEGVFQTNYTPVSVNVFEFSGGQYVMAAAVDDDSAESSFKAFKASDLDDFEQDFIVPEAFQISASSDIIISTDASTLFISDNGSLYSLKRNSSYNNGISFDYKTAKYIEEELGTPLYCLSLKSDGSYY